jgi:Spy/CpxP family protein refolding chaperone
MVRSLRKMKKKIGITLMVLLFSFAIFAIVVSAQDRMGKSEEGIQNPVPPDRQGMTGGPNMMGMGMMGGQNMPDMMGNGTMMGMRGPGGRGPMGMRPQRGMMMRLADKLNLSKEQRDELKDMFTNNRKDMIRRKADLEIARVEMQELLSQDEPDMSAIKGKIQDVANLEAEMKFSQIQKWMDAKKVLTEEQQKELKDMMKKGPDQVMNNRMGMGMRRGMPDNNNNNNNKPSQERRPEAGR